MGKEVYNEFLSFVPEGRRGKVKDFGEMKSLLPNSLSNAQIKLLKAYFHVQVTSRGGARNKAIEMMRGLVNKSGWKELERERRDLLALVDIGARGETRQFEQTGVYSMKAPREPKRK